MRQPVTRRIGIEDSVAELRRERPEDDGAYLHDGNRLSVATPRWSDPLECCPASKSACRKAIGGFFVGTTPPSHVNAVAQQPREAAWGRMSLGGGRRGL